MAGEPRSKLRVWDLPTRLASGMVELALPQKWQPSGQGLIQQIEPLPLEVMAVEPVLPVVAVERIDSTTSGM